LESPVNPGRFSWGISAGLNPYTDERIKDYDVWAETFAGQVYIECKDDFASERTPNFAIELEAYNHSKAPLFVYRIRNPDVVHAFHRYEIDSLLRAQKLTTAGRFLRYRRIQMGDQQNNLGILIPKEILKTVGRPFEAAINQLAKQAA
jgi:hypothetical protein